MSPKEPIPGYPRANKDPRQDPSDPPPRERQRSRPTLDVDREVVSDADVVRSFRSVKLSSAVWVAGITALASVVTTYMLTHQMPTDCASKGELHALDTKFDALAASVTTLGTSSTKNANDAHNELVELRATVSSNAQAEQAKFDNLSTKLDIFMQRR